MRVENLMREQLQSADLEVVLSVVTVPPNTRLPLHTHPGEEFAYVMAGSAVLVRPEVEERFVAGQTVKVSLNEVHTVRTEDEEATLIVFRVHTPGQPERILVPEA
ncbi:MAG: cupin domain-containing protein [Deltaproteobacteria bacterium]|nr:cupin domain-containing protein [Deltaproteobacteria bacterium]